MADAAQTRTRLEKSRRARPAPKSAGFLSNRFDWPASTPSTLSPSQPTNRSQLSPPPSGVRERGESINPSRRPACRSLAVIPLALRASSIHRTVHGIFQFLGLPKQSPSLIVVQNPKLDANPVSVKKKRERKKGRKSQREFCGKPCHCSLRPTYLAVCDIVECWDRGEVVGGWL